MDPNDSVSLEDAWNEEAALLAGETPPAAADSNPDEPEVTDADPAHSEQSQQPDEPESPAADPYEGLPPAAAERLRALERENATYRDIHQQLIHRVSSSEGRVAAMQREFHQARSAAASVPAGDAPTQTEIAAAAKNPEKWDKLKGEFPDWAEAMEEYVTAQVRSVAQQQPGIDPRVVAQFMRDQLAQTESRFAHRLEEARIEGRYPNWVELANTPDFVEWARAQPAEIQALANSARAADAIRMFDLYHEAKAKPASDIKQTRAGRLAAAATVRPGQTPPPRAIEDMSPEELWNHEARLREKRRQEP